MTHAVERLAAWAVDSRSRLLEAQVLHHAKRAVIDWYAAYYPGSVAAPATLLEKAFSLQDPRTRALILGSAAHTAELDDIFRDGISHPGAPTIPAAPAPTTTTSNSRTDVIAPPNMSLATQLEQVITSRAVRTSAQADHGARNMERASTDAPRRQAARQPRQPCG